MKIFLDTADLDEIRFAASLGVIDGVTTNPSLIRRAVEKRGGSISMEDYIKEIVKVVPGPVSLEVISVEAEAMIEEAKKLYRLFSPYGEVAIKIPICPSMDGESNVYDGLRAIRELSALGIPVNVTLVMTPEQALLAAKAGAAYVSPFAGRIDDYIRDKMGMKRGEDYGKADYYDFELVRKIAEKRVEKVLESKPASTSKSLYLDEEVKSVASEGQDNGVYSGVDLIARILRIFRNYGYRTEVIAASMRNARQVREVAELGVHIATVPFYVLKEMLVHYKTIEGVKAFAADVVPSYRKIFEENP
ncbi:MAG: transaldolase [Thaumarchaeota archaeon]|nr:transaldolase [Nitrososphaerota archaeon]